MIFSFSHKPGVAGIRVPRRRFTGWAALYFSAFVVLPVLVLALALDAILFLVFTRLFDSCYGLLCLTG
jgi:hypothetical protein